MYLKPFLDNIETVGRISVTENPVLKSDNSVVDYRKRVEQNRKRGNRISSLTRQARQKAKEVKEYIEFNPGFMDDAKREYLGRFMHSLNHCGVRSLYREHIDGSHLEYIGALTCKHKLCPVCNAELSKTIRRKYILYFNKHPELRKDYDFQHLTLTVPHSADGFKGKKLYADELMKAFNLMRKKKFWLDMVYAGEFGVEVTKNENGLHIHIHALLLVKKQKQNRNLLHKEILLQWNRLTVDPGLISRELTEKDIKAIRAGNKLITNDLVKTLDTRGATFIGLENLFVVNDNGVKRYIDMNVQDDFLRGLMECIKYHFEPFVLDKEKGTYDFDLLMEALPMIKGRPLYRKFGAFHGVKELNVNDRSLIREEMAEAVKETAHDQVINPCTLKPAGRDEFDYVIMNAAGVYYKPEENMKPFVSGGVKKLYLYSAHTLIDAVLDMISISLCDNKKRRQPGLHKKETAILMT